jgi:hypothetical protein
VTEIAVSRRITNSTLLACGGLAMLLLPSPFAEAQAPSPQAVRSLQRQVMQDHVVPGSALEALIRANQDVRRLRAAEAWDGIPLPPWLRVLWRKNHPNLPDLPADPTGGYPLVLQELHQWMLTHQDLKPRTSEAGASPIRSATVGGDLRTSGTEGAPRSESDIRVNYWNPSKIIGASNNIEASGYQAQYYSRDGGASWGQSYLPAQPGDDAHSDPTVEWTSDGTAWSTTIGMDATRTRLQLRSYRSADGGATWTFDATCSGDDQASADKQMTWVDHSNSSPHKDNLYVIWHNDAPVYINRRTGPNGAWQTPIRLSHAETTGTGIGGDVKTNSSGDVFAFWPDSGSGHLFLAKSTNGGVSFSMPSAIATTFARYDIGIPAMSTRRVLLYISGGAYSTPTKNMVYATWTDLTGATDCNGNANEPGTDVAAPCHTRIWLSRSSNGGVTWLPAAAVNHSNTLDDEFNPWLAVDETNGKLALIYYRTASENHRQQTDVYYQSSEDDGATWTAPLKVTAAPTDETGGGANNNQYGDYNALSGYGGVFFPSWTDRRSRQFEEIWTAPIHDAMGSNPAIGVEGVTAAAGSQSPEHHP